MAALGRRQQPLWGQAKYFMSNLISGARTTEQRTHQLLGARSWSGPHNAGERPGLMGLTPGCREVNPLRALGGSQKGAGQASTHSVPTRPWILLRG